MAMRLRVVGAFWVALCAAEFPAEPGDVYLDDAQDHAVRDKLKRDYVSEGYDLPLCSTCPSVPTTGDDA